MSATGRSEVRRAYDEYITPPWSLERLLEDYTLKQGATVLDPFAANGELLAKLKQLRPDLTLLAVEIRPECEPALKALADAGVIAGYVIGDLVALADQIGTVDYVLTNPPYSAAQACVDATNRIAAVANIHLLRGNFLGSTSRREWTAALNPGTRELPNRPSFTGFGGDATEYAWFIYKDPKVAGTRKLLALTPDEVISEWNARARAMFPDAKPARKKKKIAFNGLHCVVCLQPQLLSESKVKRIESWPTCSNGHAGADGVDLQEVIAFALKGRGAYVVPT